MQNSIREVVGPNNELFTFAEDIKTEAVRFFEDFLTQKPADIDILSVEKLKDILKFWCNEFDKEQLVKKFTEEEIDAK